MLTYNIMRTFSLLQNENLKLHYMAYGYKMWRFEQNVRNHTSTASWLEIKQYLIITYKKSFTIFQKRV